jgi:hypothetical protein
MALPKPKLEKPSLAVAKVLKLAGELTPDEQAQLRQLFLQDQEDIRIALERLKKPGRLWSLEELEQELDLAG